MARGLMTPARCTERETGASVRGSMSSDAVVVMSVRFQNPAEMVQLDQRGRLLVNGNSIQSQ
jgi:hypothetical protein